MTDYGVTPTGFSRKPLTQILADIEAAQKAAPALGPSFDVSPELPQGQINGIVADKLAEIWEALESVYGAYDVNKATGQSLTVLAALTGTERRGEAPSEVVCTVNLDAGTLLPAGSIASVDGRDDIRFTLTADVENTGGVAADFEDTVWQCTEAGPTAVSADTLTVKVSGVVGWNSITNPGPAELGRFEDSDPILFLRREQGLAQRGGSTTRAIVSDLIEVEGVNVARCYENTGSVTDENGIPPHSLEALIDDGLVPSADNDEVAQAILDTAPAGVRRFGIEEGNAIDENDETVIVAFSRCEHPTVYLYYLLTTTSKFPPDGEDQVKAAVVAAAEAAFDIGDDVVALVLQVAPLTVAGVVDVPDFAMGFDPGPTESENLEITIRQRAFFDVDNIEVET